MSRADWDFPVEVVPLAKATDNEQVPARAIVREDTGDCLAVVSDKYFFISHAEVFDPFKEVAEAISDRIGYKHKVVTHTSKNGAVATQIINFDGYTKGLHQVGDRVGLRVLITNSYTGSGATVIRIGGLVLSCLNGMVRFDNNISNIRASHTAGSMRKLSYPAGRDIVASFEQSAEIWNQYGSKRLSAGSVADAYLPQLVARDLVTKRESEDFLRRDYKTAWDLMQHVTYHNTHGRPKLNEVGKVEVLGKVNNWFERTFIND